MTTSWERVRELFLAAFDQPPDERSTFLTERCSGDKALRDEVESLLAEAEQPDALLDAPLWMGEAASDRAGDLPAGTRVGPFRIEAPIARGGMSRVYRARQQSPDRAVALKVLGVGLDADSARWRFEQEIRILAALDHPNIARIFSAGMHALHTPEGAALTLPYFGMELIEGALPVTEFAAARELDLPTRLALLETIARSVHYGHRLGIIHRDLKPANLLVSNEGVPKVIDFGVARAVESRHDRHGTVVGQVIGTPCYMSPEQLAPTSEEIDVRADVYSLGIVLYELLCSRLPYDFPDTSITTVRRCLERFRPTPPSIVASTLRGDLEVLVLTAIAKDREHRYESALALADDIRRYLDGELIEARTTTFAERSWHWVRQHLLIASLIALTTVSLTTTAVAATIAFLGEQRAFEDAERGRMAAEQARAEAERQRERARESEGDALRARDQARLQSERAQKLLELHASWLSASDLYVDGPATRMVDVLDRAAESIDDTELDPLVEVELREVLGGTMQRLGRFDIAARQYERAWELEREELGPNDVRPRATRALLARMLQQAGDLKRAHALARESVESLRDDDPAWLRQLVHGGLGAVLYELADHEAAEPHLERALELSPGDDTDGRIRHAAFVRVLGTLRRDQGRSAEARGLLEESIETFESVYGAEHALTNTARLDLAQLFLETGEIARAEEISRRAMQALEAIDPDKTHSHLARTVFARVLASRGDVPRAEAILRESVPRLRELGGVTPLFLRAQVDLGQLLAQKNEYDEAIALFSDSFEAFLAREGLKGSRTLITANELIRLLNATGHFERAAEVGLPLLAIGPPPPGTADTWTSLRLQVGNALQKLERYEEALQQYELGRQEVIDNEGESSPRLRTFDMTLMFLRRKVK